jgi:hypothetical protein
VPELLKHRFDRQGHNLLGVLQLVAKALEIWFELVAVGLVYVVTMRLASRPEGLPIGYLARPIEFVDLIGLADPLLWKSVSDPKHSTSSKHRSPRWRIWALIGMSVALCILCNLMGPAIAVLLIPSLQWSETDKVPYQTFASLNSASPPLSDGFAHNDTFYCLPDQLSSFQYSCADYDWAQKLDSWVDQW